MLRGVRLTVSGQEKAVLVGESGCGKSTLAKLLFQYYPDYTGSILFNGQQLRDIDRQSLYQRVGYIAQTTYLSMTPSAATSASAQTSPRLSFPTPSGRRASPTG